MIPVQRYLGKLIGATDRPVYGVVAGGTDPDACSLASLKTTDCLQAVGPDNTVYLEYVPSSAGGTWQSISDLLYDGGDPGGLLEFWFEGGLPHLSLDEDELLYCGGLCWSGGPLTGHLPETGGSCEGEIFTVCLSCHCCPLDGFTVAGWYCVDPGDGCEPVYLTDDDACDDAITVCSGPYDSQALAIAECGPPFPPWPCSGHPIVSSIQCIVKTGDCTCLPDTAVGIATGPTNPTQWTTVTCPGNINLFLDCVGGFLAASSPTGGITCTILFVDATICLILVEGYGANCGGGGGTAVWQLTGTF